MSDATVSAPARSLRWYLLLTAFLSGCSVMVLEMAAVRAVAPYFGASTYTWTNVIGIMMAALAAGYFLGGKLADRVPRPWVLYALLLLGGLLCTGLPLAVRPLARWLLPAELAIEDSMVLVGRASFIATLLLFAPPTLLLGAVSPMTIRLIARPDRVGGASGQVFAASTVGSILGTFLTTYCLVPELGTRLTIALAGATLVAVAVLGLLLAGLSRRRLCAVAPASVVGTVLLLLAVAHAGPIRSSPGQVTEVETAYQYARVRDEAGDPGIRLLQMNEAEQAYHSVRIPGTVLTNGRYYDYYSVLPLLLGPRGRERLDCLVIGLAAGTIPAQIHAFYPKELHITGVEIDPGILALGRRWFSLPDGADWLRAVVADGRVYLASLPRREIFDLVIVDAFAQDAYVPFHLATKETFTEARTRLRTGGVLAMNVAAFRPDDEMVGAITATVAEVFGRAYRVWVQGYPNFMVFAVKNTEAALGRLAKADGLPTTDEGEALRDLARYVASSSAVVSPGSSGPVLTDDHAPVERFTDLSLRRENRAAMGE